jgi:GTPase SAR1 family protein
MPRKYQPKSSNEHQTAINKKSKDKPTYKIIVLGCGGVGKVSFK